MPPIRKCGISSQQTPSPGDPIIPQRPPWPPEPEWPMPEAYRSLELPMVPSLLACTHGFRNTWIIFQDVGLQTELPPFFRAYLPGSKANSGVGVCMPNLGLGCCEGRAVRSLVGSPELPLSSGSCPQGHCTSHSPAMATLQCVSLVWSLASDRLPGLTLGQILLHEEIAVLSLPQHTGFSLQ